MKHQPWIMGAQPNLASKSKVMSISKCPLPKNTNWGFREFGAQKTWNFSTFFGTSALDTAYLRNETLHRQTTMPVSIYNVSPKTWPTFRDFDPETAEIRLLIVTHPSATITLQPS